jgi:hypothetical protein
MDTIRPRRPVPEPTPHLRAHEEGLMIDRERGDRRRSLRRWLLRGSCALGGAALTVTLFACGPMLTPSPTAAVHVTATRNWPMSVDCNLSYDVTFEPLQIAGGSGTTSSFSERISASGPPQREGDQWVCRAGGTTWHTMANGRWAIHLNSGDWRASCVKTVNDELVFVDFQFPNSTCKQ